MSDGSGMGTFGGGDVERDRRTVGVAGHEVASGGETLVAYGLGACVAVGIRDTANGVGSLAHVMLPERPADSGSATGKFADSAVQTTLQELVEAGGAYGTAEAFLVGGADIFALGDLPQGVGSETARVARETLDRLGVPVGATALGGDRGRTVEFDTATGEVRISMAGGDGRLLPFSPED